MLELVLKVETKELVQLGFMPQLVIYLFYLYPIAVLLNEFYLFCLLLEVEKHGNI